MGDKVRMLVSSVPSAKFYTEQMFVLASMPLRNRA